MENSKKEDKKKHTAECKLFMEKRGFGCHCPSPSVTTSNLELINPDKCTCEALKKVMGFDAVCRYHELKPLDTSLVPEWEKELARQCKIRHLPFNSVKYLVDEVLASHKEKLVDAINEARTKKPLWHDDPNRYLENVARENTFNEVLSIIQK